MLVISYDFCPDGGSIRYRSIVAAAAAVYGYCVRFGSEQSLQCPPLFGTSQFLHKGPFSLARNRVDVMTEDCFCEVVRHDDEGLLGCLASVRRRAGCADSFELLQAVTSTG